MSKPRKITEPIRTPARQQRVPERIPVGHIDRIGAQVTGWVFDPRGSASKTEFLIVLDDAVLRATTTIIRSDVVQAGFATHPFVGFSVGLSEALAQWRSTGRRSTILPRSIRLVVGNVPVAEGKLPDLSRVTGELEGLRDDAIVGLVRLPGSEDFDVEIEILVDGIVLGSVVTNARGDDDPPDIRRFKLPLPASPSKVLSFSVEARILLSGVPLLNSPVTVEASPQRRWGYHVRQMIMTDAPPPISIIVPIYNAPQDLRRCLASIIANTTRKARLILIDDASPDRTIGRILAPFEDLPNITVVRNGSNLGFSATINKGLSLAGSDDVVLLNSDTIVPPRWLENLRLAAYSHPAIGSVTPVSDNAGAFSVPEANIRNQLPPHLSPDEVGRLVAQESLGLLPDTPTTNGFCMYIRRACLDDVGIFDSQAFPRGYGEENDFCIRSMRRGWRHVVEDRTMLLHTRSASFGNEERARLSELARQELESRYHEYSFLVNAFAANRDMMLVRHRTRHAFNLAEFGHRPRPRLLTVIATETGGTPLTNVDLGLALAKDYDVFVLRSDRESLTLSKLRDGQFEKIAQRIIETPISLAKHFSSAYDNAVAEWLIEYAIELVHIRHIAWHGLGLTWVCHQLEIPVIFSFHDFYTVCPSIKLLDERLNFCRGKCTSGPGPCAAELWQPDDVPPLKHAFVETWRAQTAAMLEPVDAFVTTSESTQNIICNNIPELNERKFRVIPHGRDFSRFARAAVVPRDARPIRLLAPGNLSVAKGAQIIARLKALDTKGLFEIHTMGQVAPVLQGSDVVHHGPYDREHFLELAEQIQPHFGLVLSIWPETYCHTLTELWAAGVPVIAFDQGAIGERIRAHGGGLLVSEMSAQAVYDALTTVCGDKTAYHGLLAAVLNWQEQVAPNCDTRAMAAAYRTLYSDVLQVRRPFDAPAARQHHPR